MATDTIQPITMTAPPLSVKLPRTALHINTAEISISENAMTMPHAYQIGMSAS